jgi:hypothetical protein
MSRQYILTLNVLVILLSFIGIGCSNTYEPKPTPTPDRIFYYDILSDPTSAEVYFRIVSTVPEVRSTNRTYLGLTPSRGTQTLNIPGLNISNAVNVTIVIEIEKKGYSSRVERYNVLSILSDSAISLHVRLDQEK